MEFRETRPLYTLKEIASILRAEGGCEWDRAQNSKTLKSYLIEEAYELYDAIEHEDAKSMQEELGDVLYQVYAHAQIAEEEGKFTVDDVARGIAEKLVRRHPHVFGNEGPKPKEQVSIDWEKIKKKEKAAYQSILDGVPGHAPALQKAYRVQQKVSRIGFDWDRIDDVVTKLDEEIAEFKEALASGSRDHLLEEIGDILFTLTNISRFLSINPEEALKKTVDKFMNRFRFVEDETRASGKNLEEMSLTEMDALWDRAKSEMG
ncbi:MAG: nucleoside triphosphate pyrophosphohydrolase [Spirochaetes bacterium]|nr:nucleoside triphosphate pyrophosphohydrolase [Spirochaetota bacterium]